MIGHRIKQLRNDAGMTQDELGFILNLKKSAISKYENGYSIPSLDVVNHLADIFNVSTDYLIGRTNSRQSIDTHKSFKVDDIQNDFHELLEKFNTNHMLKCNGKVLTEAQKNILKRLLLTTESLFDDIE